ncbi:MAG: efflux RND transporter periplasmic adaptor subunit [Gammaproteobacteria bacterium]|jgi:membrane fusion protein (multidrug efflux system)|nr:efflux RND transporter periplasmic adaptor subunit [Gammaproteobacteria bacterium]
MKKPMFIMLVLCGLVFGGIFGWKAFVAGQIAKSMQTMTLPPVTVSTAPAELQTWSPSINVVGTLESLQGVDVTAQLAGLITELHFESGDTVAAGALLVQQYTANDKAQLAGLIAATRLAEMNFKRSQDLRKQNLISEFDYDVAVTDLDRARAAEEDLRLRIQQLAIRAPFSGQLGIRLVDVGQYVEPGDTLVRLENLEKMRVNFTVPQREIAAVTPGRPIALKVDAWPGESFTGEVTAVAPRIDADTRTLMVQGLVRNPEQKLRPGMFAQVSIELDTRTDVVTVPQAAITYSPYGDSVFVVLPGAGPDAPATVKNTFVVTGATRGDQVAIETGLQAGAEVVTAGQQKLRNGATVVVDNSVPVSNQATIVPGNN